MPQLYTEDSEGSYEAMTGENDAIEERIKKVRNEQGPYASFSLRNKYTYGPFYYVMGKDGDVIPYHPNCLPDEDDNEDYPLMVEEDDGTPALADECVACERKKVELREEKIEEWMKELDTTRHEHKSSDTVLLLLRMCDWTATRCCVNCGCVRSVRWHVTL